MGKKRKPGKKRGKRKRRSKSGLYVWLTGLLLTVAGGLAALFYFGPQGGSSLYRAAFEEIHIRPNPTQEYVGRIDRALYQTLQKRGVHERSIQFTDVGYRTGNGDAWDFTEVTVRFRDESSMRLAEREMISRIAAVGPLVEWWMEAEPHNGIAFRVYVGNRFTHRIRLLIEEKTRPEPPPVRHLPRIAIIVDDLGYDMAKARAFASLDIPVALSVLPMSQYAGQIARELQRSGRELMLHLPMEPKGYPEVNPGPGALLRSMEPHEIRGLVLRHLRELPGAAGVNNHMGSSFTEDHGKMTVFLEEIAKSGLYFVDSKTTPRSVGHGLARKMGVPSAVRDVFLDNDQCAAAIGIQFERLLGRAKLQGEAVGIAHPFSETLKALKSEGVRLRREAEVVPVSELVR